MAVSFSLSYHPDSMLARFPFINFYNGKIKGEETPRIWELGSYSCYSCEPDSLLAMNTICWDGSHRGSPRFTGKLMCVVTRPFLRAHWHHALFFPGVCKTRWPKKWHRRREWSLIIGLGHLKNNNVKKKCPFLEFHSLVEKYLLTLFSNGIKPALILQVGASWGFFPSLTLSVSLKMTFLSDAVPRTSN